MASQDAGAAFVLLRVDTERALGFAQRSEVVKLHLRALDGQTLGFHWMAPGYFIHCPAIMIRLALDAERLAAPSSGLASRSQRLAVMPGARVPSVVDCFAARAEWRVPAASTWDGVRSDFSR